MTWVQFYWIKQFKCPRVWQIDVGNFEMWSRFEFNLNLSEIHVSWIIWEKANLNIWKPNLLKAFKLFMLYICFGLIGTYQVWSKVWTWKLAFGILTHAMLMMPWCKKIKQRASKALGFHTWDVTVVWADRPGPGNPSPLGRCCISCDT